MRFRAIELALTHKLDDNDPYWAGVRAAVMVEYNDRILNAASLKFAGMMDQLSAQTDAISASINHATGEATEAVSDATRQSIDEVKRMIDDLPNSVSEITSEVGEKLRSDLSQGMSKVATPVRDAVSELIGILRESKGKVESRFASDLEKVTNEYYNNMCTLAGNEHTAFRENIKKTIEQAAKQMVTVEVKHQMKMEKTYAALSVIAKAAVLSLAFLAGFHLADMPPTAFGGICHNVSTLIFGWFW
jgi:polyhydroxyalkanoate synthesis regulator phasin